MLRIIRQWRNLRMIRRGGRGNDRDEDVANTKPGELAVQCIACPDPEINLPVGWDKVPPELW